MPISPSIKAGLSNATTNSRFSTLASRSQSPTATVALSHEDPNQVIDYSKKNGSITSLSFPVDWPVHHFTLIENDWEPVSSKIIANKFFRLPLPQGMTDEYSVQYDQNFAYTDFLKGIASIAPTSSTAGIFSAVRIAARGIGAATGVSLNTFKSVTLSAPNFREFTFSWKLSPKNFAESQIIQKMVFAFKRGMSPDRQIGFVFRFPQIYSMYFTPNSSFLYKFKPAVLKQISVNYAGGNPYASFYKPQGGNPANTPPESVIISMQFLELEYWIKEDFKPNGDTPDFAIPTNDPLDNWNFYNKHQSLSNLNKNNSFSNLVNQAIVR